MVGQAPCSTPSAMRLMAVGLMPRSGNPPERLHSSPAWSALEGPNPQDLRRITEVRRTLWGPHVSLENYALASSDSCRGAQVSQPPERGTPGRLRGGTSNERGLCYGACLRRALSETLAADVLSTYGTAGPSSGYRRLSPVRHGPRHLPPIARRLLFEKTNSRSLQVLFDGRRSIQ